MNGVFLNEGEQVEHGRPDEPAQNSSTSSRTSASSRRPRSSARSPHPTRTGRSSRRSRSYALEHEERYGRFPKTLIFAANDLPHTSHADQLVDICPRRLRPRRRVRPEDHRPRRPAAAAHPRVPQPPEPARRRHGRPADDRRGHPGPGVHRLPAAGEVPHPLRADARPRHAQGRAVPRQVPLHRLRLLRRHAARVLPQGDGITAEPPDKRTRTIEQIIEDIWNNRDRDYNSAAWSSGCSASTRRCPARPASCSPRSFPTATWPSSPAELPDSLRERLHRAR